MSAQQAYELGLINNVLPHDEPLPYTRKMPLKLAPPGGPALPVRLAKRAVRRQLIEQIQRALDEENIGLNQGIHSEDFMAAITARMEKRMPIYKGK